MNFEIEDIYTLTPMQQGILYDSMIQKNNRAYFLQMNLDVIGTPDLNLFKKSFELLIKKYEVLRTLIISNDVEEPLQVVLKEREAEFNYIDLTDRSHAINEILNEDVQRGFNLSEDPLVRLTVIHLKEEKYKFVWSWHHIILDGWCIHLLISDFMNFYQMLLKSEEVNIGKLTPYSKYINWLSSQNQEEAGTYWRKYLEDYDNKPMLPGAFKSKKKFEGKAYTVELTTSQFQELNKVAIKYQVTLNSLIQTIFGILLSKYNDVNDIVFGSVVSGRPPSLSGVETMVGLFINTLPVRVNISGKRYFSELINEIHHNSILGEAYHYHPLYNIQSYNSLKQELTKYLIVFENYPTEPLDNGRDNLNFKVTGVDFFEQFNNDFTLVTLLTGNSIQFKINYNESTFDKTSIEKIMAAFLQLINQVCSNPELKIEDLDIVSNYDLLSLSNFNNTFVPYQKHKNVIELFEEQVSKTPNQNAVCCNDLTLTYRQLNQDSNGLARYIRSFAIKPDTIIGLYVDRSIEMVVGLLGILKSGGAYLPLDPTLPENRISYMVKDSGVNLIVTQGKYVEELKSIGVNSIITIEDNVLFEDQESVENVNKPSDLAYLIYTSGSTGKPKGVMIEHSSISNFIEGMNQVLNFEKKFNRILSLTTMSFDIFFLETIMPLTKGFEVFIADSEKSSDPKKILNLIDEHKINVLQVTPSRMESILTRPESTLLLENLHQILIGGEKLRKKIVDKLTKFKNTEIYNVYGPTETTIWSTISKVKPGSKATIIGKPIANTKVFILDRSLNNVPIGTYGELCIAGEGLARGYYNQTELTFEKFIYSSSLNERIYRTGDIARWLPNGEIEFFGRRDNQLKIRGYRIETGEIEAEIAQLVEVNEVAVIGRENQLGDITLYAYITTNTVLSAEKIKKELSKRLPTYMIPSHFVFMKSFPINQNGKIDRTALMKSSLSIYKENLKPKHNQLTEYEIELIEVWRDILNIQDISIHDDFFEIGGHSILAIKFEVEMEKRYLPITLADLNEFRTIKELASLANERKNPAEIPFPSLLPESSNIIKPISLPSEENSFVIDGIEPFNDFFYKSCFYNSLFPILDFYDLESLAIISNDLITYKFDSEKSNLLVQYKPNKSMEMIMDEYGIQVIGRNNNTDLIENIKNALLNNRPVIIWVDCYYESIRSETYQKIHWPHTWLIYGFNEHKKSFHIIEHEHRLNLNYKKMEVSYDDTVACHKGFLEEFKASLDVQPYYEFQVEKLQSVNRNVIKKSYESFISQNEEALINGLKNLQSFVNYLMESYSYTENQQIILDDNLLEMLNQVINAKVVENNLVLKLYGSSESDLYEMSLNKWVNVRNLIAKYTITKSLPKGLKTAITELKSIEEQLFRKIINKFNKEPNYE
ncbi:non-ribosomal peptide synthetase [Bacillus pseudomycoides]|uniref:non-ribosomal peptide synthetase n=1 Tax=Bacillus pseudomycoides TaxID=64104 RepID=UPI000BEC6567|nr:non-ribosomal peptide synthetase [Bacillus pseudomycoides]PEA82337.1 hypothetical protein CON99_17700 [Bacillus pseudomycoides]PED73217.1 hypothetical protein CON97_04770 [Bacillus pseudomycoides]PEI43668.1 hypothetical protein CN620_07220 [Bacillus pseudomycoides]PEJ80761.1 hypothetical protein CN680_06420 [Bacillus pseudomycoides]PEM15983.1 hypothetical protein CN628_15065 [Bacillus pseudomycoides]